ncbi:MAG: nuclear transport factor 2 family protein [Rubrivivax sp.]|nr:nuclear transport factor 2 family protein [Rubrivivax sp.]
MDESHPVGRWHAMLQRRDPRELDGWLADDVTFWSPVVHKPQQGKVLTTWYLAAAFRVFFNDSFRYVREIVGPNDAMLEFETTIDGTLVNGVDLLKWNDAGRVTEFKVMVRPLKAIQLIHERMASMLQVLQQQQQQ